MSDYNQKQRNTIKGFIPGCSRIKLRKWHNTFPNKDSFIPDFIQTMTGKIADVGRNCLNRILRRLDTYQGFIPESFWIDTEWCNVSSDPTSHVALQGSHPIIREG